MNIRDILNDPYTDPQQWNSKFSSMLVFPLIFGNKLIAVIEMYRKSGFYTEYDERIIGKVSRILSKVPAYCYVFNLPEEAQERNEMEEFKSRYIKTNLEKLQKFSLNSQNHAIDYLTLVTVIEKSVRSVVDIDQCTLFVVDKDSDILWSKKFD
jgi:hypothetical protein